MERKPWIFVLLAIIQFVMPIVGMISSARLSGLSFFIYLDQFFGQTPALRLFNYFGPDWICAIAIYAVKPWSYPVFLSSCGWMIYWTVVQYSAKEYSFWILVTYLASNLAVVTYFMLPAVRAPFFNRKLRWWEAKPRYRVQFSGDFFENGKTTAHFSVINISEGGILAESKNAHFQVGEVVELSINFLGQSVRTSGTIAHRGATSDSRVFLGVHFNPSDRSFAKIMKSMIHTLEVLEVDRRPARINRLKDFASWAKKAVESGEGLIPRIQKK